MRFQVDREQLTAAMSIVASIVPSRTIKPILNNVHIVVDHEHGCVMTSTDLEIAVRYSVPVISSTVPGEALVNGQRLAAILRECNSASVEIDAQDDGKIKLKAGRSTFNLLAEQPAEFPVVAPFREAGSFLMNRDRLVTLIHKTIFAVAREKSRFGFNGARLQIEGGEARMIATDGKRLAMMLQNIVNPDGVTVGHIIPARALTVFEKLLGSEDDTVRISLDDKDIMIKTRRAELTSRLVEGSFPNYQAVIPRDCPIQVRFNRLELLAAFRQAALLTSQESRSVKLTIGEGKALLRAQAVDAGEAEIEIDAPDYQGEPMTFAFNPDFVNDGLKAMESEEVNIGFGKPTQPARLVGDENFVYVVMPVTLRTA